MEARPFLLMLAAFFLLRESIQVVRRYLVHAVTTGMEKQTTVRLIAHLLQLDLISLSASKIGSLHGRIHRGVEGLLRFLMLAFNDFLPALFTAGFAVGVAIERNWQLGLLMGAIVPVELLIVSRQIVSQRGIRVGLLQQKEMIDGLVVEQLIGIEDVRAANTHDYEVKRVEQRTDALRRKELKHHIAMAWYDCGKALTEGAFFLATIAVAINMAAKGEISVGEILTAALLFANILMPMREVHRIVDEASESALSVDDLVTMLSQPKDRSFDDVAKETPIPCAETPIISCRDLRFGFSSNGNKPITVLNGITVDFHLGEIVGIVGLTGCGKSSLIKLFLRLLHPASGALLLCGIPIEKVSREGISRLIGYVGQVPFLFAGTIEENIAYGSNGATMEEIQEAAKMACIHDEIMAKPEKYQTVITERGQSLSGGQRQRIAIARALLRSRPVLILDEATSALDNIREAGVLASLAAMKVKPIVIMVAHRLTTLRAADRILVFENGRIVQEGSYDQLLNVSGVFKQMVNSVANHDARK
jgi:ATP-binding cassette subfamily B protein